MITLGLAGDDADLFASGSAPSASQGMDDFPDFGESLSPPPSSHFSDARITSSHTLILHLLSYAGSSAYLLLNRRTARPNPRCTRQIFIAEGHICISFSRLPWYRWSRDSRDWSSWDGSG